jgi:ParB/RepB/Spo0J family partition protein
VSHVRPTHLDPWAISLNGYNARATDAREPDEHLLASIRELGVLEPPGVRFSPHDDETHSSELDESVSCVYGFRRVLAARILELTEIPVVWVADKDGSDRVANLAENLHRKNLRTWEIAQALHELAEETGQGAVELGLRIGLSEGYVANLLRMRRKLAPDVWRQVQTWGVSEKLSIEFLIEICALPWDEQIERYNQALDLSHGARRGNEVAPGRAKIRKMLARVEQRSDVFREGQGFAAGVKYALRVVLGREAWRHGGVVSDRTRRRRHQERKGKRNVNQAK